MKDFAPHFSQAELEHSSTAIAHQVDNSCPEELLPDLVETSWMAERAREILGCPLRVDSGYRTWAVNALVGGSKTSVHPMALAVDLVPLGGELDVPGAFAKLRAHPTFMAEVDQMIVERGCLHLGRPRPGQAPRHELRGESYDAKGGRHYPPIGIWTAGEVSHG